jgi:hypothetical protein
LPTLYANQIGPLAAQALRLGDESTIGQVIATFSNSFYVKTRDDQLLFITNRSVRSPITVNVAYSGRFTDIVKPLEPVYLHDQQLSISNLSIKFTSTPDEDEKVLVDKDPYYLKLMEASMLLSTILNMIENTGSSLDQNQLVVHDSIGDFVRHGLLPLRNMGIPQSEFAATALKIIGLGPGFTPSGDDFLLGFLVIYNSLSPAVGRTSIYLEFEQLAARTNWVSAKLVDYAQHLQVDDQLLRVIRSMSNAHVDTVTALEALIPRGHTSGIDIATGAVLGLSVVCDIALGRTNTEIVTAKLGFP